MLCFQVGNMFIPHAEHLSSLYKLLLMWDLDLLEKIELRIAMEVSMHA